MGLGGSQGSLGSAIPGPAWLYYNMATRLMSWLDWSTWNFGGPNPDLVGDGQQCPGMATEGLGNSRELGAGIWHCPGLTGSPSQLGLIENN